MHFLMGPTLLIGELSFVSKENLNFSIYFVSYFQTTVYIFIRHLLTQPLKKPFKISRNYSHFSSPFAAFKPTFFEACKVLLDENILDIVGYSSSQLYQVYYFYNQVKKIKNNKVKQKKVTSR